METFPRRRRELEQKLELSRVEQLKCREFNFWGSNVPGIHLSWALHVYCHLEGQKDRKGRAGDFLHFPIRSSTSSLSLSAASLSWRQLKYLFESKLQFELFPLAPLFLSSFAFPFPPVAEQNRREPKPGNRDQI